MALVCLGYTVKYRQIQFSLTLRGPPFCAVAIQRTSRTDIHERAHIYFLLRSVLFHPYISLVMESNWISESEAIGKTVSTVRGLAGADGDGGGGGGGECG